WRTGMPRWAIRFPRAWRTGRPRCPASRLAKTLPAPAAMSPGPSPTPPPSVACPGRPPRHRAHPPVPPRPRPRPAPARGAAAPVPARLEAEAGPEIVEVLLEPPPLLDDGASREPAEAARHQPHPDPRRVEINRADHAIRSHTRLRLRAMRLHALTSCQDPACTA